MRTVLLTGATGFIGAHLAERLLEETAGLRLWVRRRTNLIGSLERAGVRVYLGHPANRIALRQSLQGVDAVIHCAGATKALNEEQYFEANVELTRYILEMIKAPQRFIFISSQAAAGPSATDKPLDESVAPHPISHYGRSKLYAENCVRKWGAQNSNGFTILRPSVVYGPGEKDLYNYFKWISKGVLPIVKGGRQQISIVHVDDLVSAVVAAARRHPAGETFFVANDLGCSIQALGHSIGAVLNKENLVYLRLPIPVLDSIALLSDAVSIITRKPALLGRQKVLEIKAAAWLCSNAAIREKIGWSPRIPLKDGIKQTAEWYIRQGWLAG